MGTSMSSQRDGSLLGQNTGVTISNDWYIRKGLKARPSNWTNTSGSSNGGQVEDDTARRAIVGGMRQICRCLAMPRFDVDKRFNIRGAILEFVFDRNHALTFSGIVSLTTMIDKPIQTPRRTTSRPPPKKHLQPQLNTTQTFSPPPTSPPPLSRDSSSELMNSTSQFITSEDFVADLMDTAIDQNTTPIPATGSYLLTTPHTTLHTLHTPHTPHTPHHPHTHRRTTPTRPDTAPSQARRFTPTGRPVPLTKRIGGGHSYSMSVESMTSTRYTGMGSRSKSNNRNNRNSRRTGGTRATKSILLAHGARHCDPPALVAMAHQIDHMSGDLQELVAQGKELEEQVRGKDHMLSVAADSAQQLDLRIQYLEHELQTTTQTAAARETELLKDLHETKKNLDRITAEHATIKIILESKEAKLSVVQASATEERETIMRRMVEYDHNNRTLTAELEKRDVDIKSISIGFAKEKAANEALKLQLAELQDSMDSMGTSNLMMGADIHDVTQERNELYRGSSGVPPPLQYKRGPAFKLYAWDILASHPNPRAELEIVYSIFNHFDITLSQIYVHYATSSSTVFASGASSIHKRRGSSRSSRRKTTIGSGRLRLLMTKTDFRTFAQEAQIWDHPLFTWAFIDLAYSKSILGGTSKGGREVVLEATNLNGGKNNRKERYFVPQGTMTKRDFKEALLRVSHARFPHLANVGEKLECLFEKHLIPYCEAALVGVDVETDEEDDVVRLSRKYGF